MNYEEILENQDLLSADATKIFWNKFNELGIEIPDSKNTRFKLENAMSVVLQMSRETKYATSTTKKLKSQAAKHERETGQVIRVPQSGWTRGKLTSLDPAGVERWCNRTMKFMAGRR